MEHIMLAIINAGAVKGKIKAPASKSMAHRAVLCAGLSRGYSRIYNLEYSKDIAATIGGIRQMGAKVTPSVGKAEIEGKGGFATIRQAIQCGESGSTLRFLIPLASLTGQRVEFIGARRLFERPQVIYETIFKTRNLVFEQGEKSISIQGALSPGEYRLPGNVSSQFISGLLFTLPLMRGDSDIIITPPFESKSYVNLTMSALKDFGIKAEFTSDNVIHVDGNQLYYPCEYTVEGDYSQAAFWAVLGSALGGVDVTGLRHDSLQGDKVIMSILTKCGAKMSKIENGFSFDKSNLKGTEIDLQDCPDLGPVLMALGILCDGETVIKNAGRLRIKESDRISAMEEEITKLGGEITSTEDTVTIKGSKLHSCVNLNGHNDHRVVMALSVLAIAAGINVEISGAEAVAKSYPDFFDDLISLGARVDVVDE